MAFRRALRITGIQVFEVTVAVHAMLALTEVETNTQSRINMLGVRLLL